MTVGSLLAVEFDESRELEVFKMMKDPWDTVQNQQSGTYEVSCPTIGAFATDEHLVVKCDTQLIVLQSLVKVEKPEPGWFESIAGHLPSLFLLGGLGFTAWWQYRNFTKKKEQGGKNANPKQQQQQGRMPQRQ